MPNKKIYAKGFTLIELLVVVAIIALLTTVTLGYLGGARKKGNDAAIKSNLATVKTASEIFFLNNNNSYLPSFAGSTLNLSTPCPANYVGPIGSNMFVADRVIFDALSVAVSKGNGSYCYNSANAWSVAIGLSFDPTNSWCVDSAPSAKVAPFVPASAIDPVTNLCK